MQINGGEVIRSDLTKNAMGGSELMGLELVKRIPYNLLEDYQIFISRVDGELDPNKIRILWLQDLSNDPASEHLANGGWRKFHKIVFNSNWQMQAYINYFGIPWEHCCVLLNAITENIPPTSLENWKPGDTIRLGYWSTPHRGLEILVPVFDALCKNFDNIELNVFSSFNIYGWGERDVHYKELFERCEAHPKINYFGSVSNKEIHKQLANMHIFAYPSIWPETSCITLMEAMAAGLLCVHSNFACLYETAANWTHMYQYVEDPNNHAAIFYAALHEAIEKYNSVSTYETLTAQSSYANLYYSWDKRAREWVILLRSLKNVDRAIPEVTGYFQYKVN